MSKPKCVICKLNVRNFNNLILGNYRDNLGPRRSLASNKRQSSLEDPSSGKCMSEDGAAVVRRMSGDASEKSDVTSESMPPNAANTPGKFSYIHFASSCWYLILHRLWIQIPCTPQQKN